MTTAELIYKLIHEYPGFSSFVVIMLLCVMAQFADSVGKIGRKGKE